MSKPKLPAMDGWFTMDTAAPHLLGSRCATCKSYFFPKESLFCRNPSCAGREFEDVPLSRTGHAVVLHDQPLPAAGPVRLTRPLRAIHGRGGRAGRPSSMVVLGQLAHGVDPDDLKVGMTVELVLETLYDDDEAEYVVWKWKPAAA